jgi:two-component system sensor histidine kinase HydH
MDSSVTRAHRSRWVVVALPGAGALLMLVVLALGWVQTRRSAELVLRGEATLLADRVGRAVRDLPVSADDDALRTLVAAEARAGLLFAALVQDNGEVTASSSALPANFPAANALRPGDVRRDGETAWTRSQGVASRERHPPPRDDRRPPPPDDRPRPPRDDAPPPPRGPRPPAPSILLQFEPHLVARIDGAANATLAAGILGAAGLLLLGALALRLLRRNEESLRRLEKERRLASLGTMSAVVAHELRNPLAALKGHAQLLVESLETHPREKAQAERVVDAAWRLERLSASLLELARTGALVREAAAPASLVRAAVAPLDAARIRLDDSRSPTRWSLDPLRFQQVITNLVENALQSTTEGPVEVRVAEEGGRLVVEVRDHGPGVPDADRERIFEPFVTSRAKGVGLGLAVARQVVALHQGTLAVLDAPGGGACFRIEIPPA